MHTRIFTAALAALVVLLPLRLEAQSSITAARTRTDTASQVVGELLAHGQQLSLTSGQIDKLTALATRSRKNLRRLQIVGFDRVPGKSVPRFVRVYPNQREARAMLFRLLTPDQRVEADKLLHDGKLVKTARR